MTVAINQYVGYLNQGKDGHPEEADLY